MKLGDLCFLLIFLVTVHQSLASDNSNKSRAFGAGFTTVTDFTSIPFVIRFQDPITTAHFGLGLAYNSQWIITNQAVGAELLLLLTAGGFPIAIETDFTTSTTTEHLVKRSIVNPDFDGVPDPHDNVAIVRVCPKLKVTTFASIPSTIPLYTVAETMVLYGYAAPDYKTASFPIVVDSGCNTIDTAFTTEANFCLFNVDTTVSFEQSDIDNFVFVLDSAGNYIGHITTLNTDTGTGLISFTVYKSNFGSTWISGNTPVVEY